MHGMDSKLVSTNNQIQPALFKPMIGCIKLGLYAMHQLQSSKLLHVDSANETWKNIPDQTRQVGVNLIQSLPFSLILKKQGHNFPSTVSRKQIEHFASGLL